MTAASMQGDPRPPDRVRHSWRCTRRGALVETVRTDAAGLARVVTMCQECGATDLLARLRDREATP
jgi:hypothetical protein